MRRREAGVTLLELMVAASILTVISGGIYSLLNTGIDTYRIGMKTADIERRTAKVLEQVAEDLSAAGRNVVFPVPTHPNTSSEVTFQKNVGFSGGTSGVIQWSPMVKLVLRPDPGDPNDGKDNNGNGLVDECVIVRIVNVGDPNERSTVLTRWVREYLEGEEPNGIDDNGNGLVDEPGLSFDVIGDVWTVRLTLEQFDANGRLVTHSMNTSIKTRN
jgi:prepilin-type N-terminal cleavage/methylation domain-containing protein